MITFRRLGRLGRLGNQLFQYAATRLYAELNGFSFSLPPWAGDSLFSLPRTRSSIRFVLPTVQLDDLNTRSASSRLLAPLGLWHRGSMRELWQNPRDNLNLYGYLQDEATLAMLRGHRDIIKGWLRFKPEIEDSMRIATDQYRPWVAAHVRRGDLMEGNRRVVPLDSYRTVLPHVIADRRLFVAADDIAIANEFSSLHPFTIQYANLAIPDWVADFWMLKESAAILAGGSTFSWWAAFLGDAEYWAPPLSHTWPADYQPILERRTP